jgi:hypothetical protein
MKNPDFFLTSASEGYDFKETRKCKIIKRLRSKNRDDLMMIKIDPPVIGQKYGLGGKDIDIVFIATRHQGDSLFPIKKWPVFVHVARFLINNPEERDVIDDNEFESIAWAEIYKTESDANTSNKI